MKSELMRAFASVAVDAGLSIREGSRLRITGSGPQRELMREIARAAYERGAALVRVDYDDPRLSRIRADYSRDTYLDEVSPVLKAESEALALGQWSLLRLLGEEEPDAMEGADQDRLTRIQRARSEAVESLRAAQMASRVPWCVMPAATDSWAESILGPKASSDDLWEVLGPILRLDRADPSAELRAHMASLGERARALNALGLRELRFKGPLTDLRVGLAPGSTWLGGSDKTPSGIVFMANIPTEETFATPDFRLTEGHAALTRPVRIHGSVVEGAVLRFEHGLVVEAKAKRGEAALKSYLETDSGSRRLGEVALVDSGNPIGKTGLVFDNPLIDENAACHIALGAGYEMAFEGSLGWDEAAKVEQGFNPSIVHEDLMIGSPEIDVVGVDAAGREIPLLRKGSFVAFP
jgi:aminopeptidase